MRKLRTKLLVVIGILMMVSGAASAASVSTAETPLPPTHSVYLKLDGIVGESTARNYERWIELTDVQFGVSNGSANSAAAGGGGSAGKAVLDHFTLAKSVDSSSIPLFQAALAGTYIKNGQLVIVTRGDSPAPLLSIDLSSIILADYEFDNERETIQLKFDAIKLSYFPTRPDGSKSPPTTGGWNFKQNVKT
ncbi:Hcp family type VI secretion system effector [Cohnella herbarum]|uniref:Type VI secretion system tube protein Hcp n=1 Tax=Cohnella herbarum TaxID=2728023 RepID=A0A7Z2VNU3_9BACL|nr:type VI secretion system tube protein Hcp [Cohnella herbarum]QJD86458.1 type VI secretion system tube protein Hcp [Cohnella herbarum]